MNSPTPILDRIRQREAAQAQKVIDLRRQPRWIARRQQERQGQSPFLAVQDTTDWRPGPDAA